MLFVTDSIMWTLLCCDKYKKLEIRKAVFNCNSVKMQRGMRTSTGRTRTRDTEREKPTGKI